MTVTKGNLESAQNNKNMIYENVLNHTFLFMDRCNVYDYTDDNSIINSSTDIETVMPEARLSECDPVVHRQ